MQAKVRRLPVIDPEGELQGNVCFSMNDITSTLKEKSGRKPLDLSFSDVVQTYKAICAHPFPRKT